MTHSNLFYWLAVFHTQGITRSKFNTWLATFKNIETIFHATRDDWLSAHFSLDDFNLVKNANVTQAEADLMWRNSDQAHHILTSDDEAYPQLLKEIYDPPFVLFVKGDKTVLHKKQMAIVGTRHPTDMGVQNAKWFAQSLTEAGLAITSGMARGIDTASHKGCLAANGTTLAVWGTGLKHCYPASNINLAAMIVDKGGALISELPLSAPPHAGHFPKRNRLISGLSLGVLVVEAALRSGSLITARFALEQGREVFTLPGNIHQPVHRGCHHLIRQGAKLVENVTDILEELCALSSGFHHQSAQKESTCDDKMAPFLKPEEQVVMRLIDYEATPIDIIQVRSGLTISECSSILLLLELAGYIQSVPGGYIRQINNERGEAYV